MGSRAEHRVFFETIVREAERRHRLMMLALRLGGVPIAMKCCLTAGEGSFAFKIAYDEAQGRCSPGVLLQVENIRRFHEHGELRWMDSCAHPNSRLFRELWIDRRLIETTLVPSGRAASGLVVSLMPFARWVMASSRARLFPGRRSGSRAATS